VSCALDLLHRQLLIQKLEKIQKRATKLVIAVRTFKYEDRLKYLDLPTLKYRRIRADMIQVYKLFTGKYDSTVTSWSTTTYVERKYDLRSHRFSIYQFPIQFNMHKFNFTNTIISVWNSLPDFVVSADTVDAFKIRLDRFWIDQEIKYNWKADTRIGSRSQINVILD